MLNNRLIKKSLDLIIHKLNVFLILLRIILLPYIPFKQLFLFNQNVSVFIIKNNYLGDR